MTSNHTMHAIESPVAFCRRLSEAMSSEGFDVRVQPGDHLVDDAGADSLVVMSYILFLQELGLKIDIGEFDLNLLNTDVAYQMWLQLIASQTHRGL